MFAVVTIGLGSLRGRLLGLEVGEVGDVGGVRLNGAPVGFG